MSTIAEKLSEELREHFNFNQAKWIPLSLPKKIAFYDQWLSRGWAGEMQYLERHRPKKAAPTTLLADARSILVVTKSYVPAVKPHKKLPGLRIAAYAQNEDYHEWFKGELAEAVHLLKLQFPEHHFRHGTDSDPVLERDYAFQAGIGWWGKNTCVIHPKDGSFTFIGEILSTLEVQTEFAPIPDFCGTCTRCMDICPTGAIEKPRELNATKCISYWTIEAKTIAPENLREKFGDWFFGCDLCQSVCPWNSKPFRGQAALETALQRPATNELKHDLEFILTASDKEIRAFLKGTALERAKPKGLRRNALIVIANQKIHELSKVVEKYRESEELGELAKWTAEKISI